MKSPTIARILHGALILTALCTFANADSGRPAPQFTARTLDGEVFTNESLSGNVVLLQFWATWCPYCRADQPAVDRLERTFANKGLVILAVDVGESEAVVRKYLGAHPRSVRVVLNDGLAAKFGAHGFPFYALIDREGNIAGTQSGSGGEESLRKLLSRAGLSMHSGARQADDETLDASPSSRGVKVIDVPRTRTMVIPPKRTQKTIFVFVNGERLEVNHFTIDGGFLHLAIAGQQRTVALGTLDIKATIAANHERGIELKIPQSRSEVTIAF